MKNRTLPDRREFTVRGRWPFPYDMLRYDACWPKSEATDSAALETLSRDTTRAGVVEVTLETHQPNNPTSGRWDSFGWKVVSVDGVKQYPN